MKLGAQLRNPTTDPGGDGLTVSHSATEGFWTKGWAAADASKAHGKKTQATEAQEKKRPPRKMEGVGDQLLDHMKELTMMKDYIWQEMDYAQKKICLLRGLPGFLGKYLTPEKEQNALH